MNKIIKTLLVVMVLVLALAALVACDQPVESTTTTNPAPEACTHSCVQEYLPGYDATCTEEGLRPGFKCPDCGELTKEQVVVPARGHKMADATCTAPSTCTECGLKEGEALGHDMQAVEAVDGCEYAPGYNAHMACTRCDYTEGKEVVVVEHDFVEEELFYYPADPTCTEGAYIAGYCVYCEKGLIIGEVPALGHTWVGGDCTTPETCSACGAEGELIHTELEDGTCACGYVLVETAEELIAALEAGKKVLLMNDIEMDATLKCPYGNSVGVAQKGGELNGNGYTLTVNGSGNYYAIITYGGTIKNLKINAGFRAVVTYTPTEDVVLDNVTIVGDSICYGFNTAEHATLEGIDLVVKNSTICGWVSFDGGFESVSFENCNFVQGTYYNNVVGRLVKPYVSTTFTNCTFVTNAYLDLSTLEAGATVVLTGCKVAGVDVTLDVFTTEEDHAEIPFTYEAPAGVELVLTAVEGGVSFHRHGHTLSETVASSCTVAGKEVYTCACGDSYENALELGEHDYDHVVTAPTCTAAGYTTHTCVFCDDSYTDTEVAALGHADENGDYKCDGCATKMLPADGEALTIPQALAIAKLAGTSYTTQKYYITGTIKNVYNTQYGNMYIVDEDGNELCIYGLYTWDKAVRYDAMSYKPVAGDEVTVYTVLGMYNTTCQGKDAWLDEVVAHEHDYKSVVTDPSCLTEGYTTDTCSICGTSNVHSTVEALGHTTDAGECERCGQTIGGDAPVVGTLAEFTFGANGSATHKDPSSKFSNGKSYTVNGYTLKFTSATNCYDGGNDAKGNSCMKMGTSSAVGSFTVTVPDNVTEVVIYVAQYKANTTKISVNGGAAQTITTASNNGAYTAIVIDTSVNKTFTFATVSGGVRCMIDTIVFNGTAQ